MGATDGYEKRRRVAVVVKEVRGENVSLVVDWFRFRKMTVV